MHSSNSTNMEAQLSMGWSGLNFSARGMRVCDCSELLQYPGHAYSVAGPWASTDGGSVSAPSLKPNPGLFTYFFLFSPSSEVSFFPFSLPPWHLSPSSHLSTL